MKKSLTKYPIILVHGIIVKDVYKFKAFGSIEKNLNKKGYVVFTADTDGFGTIKDNAKQLKNYILYILNETNSKKVNLIAHSKGGLDSKFMIENLEMEDKVASLTTICTPFKGSEFATKLLKMPKVCLKICEFWINLFYKILKDEKPDCVSVCKELKKTNTNKYVKIKTNKVFCQSYSAVYDKTKSNFVTDIPMHIFKQFHSEANDGLVSANSSIFGDYKGDCMKDSLSHTQVIDFMTTKQKRKRVLKFYYKLCDDLSKLGF